MCTWKRIGTRRHRQSALLPSAYAFHILNAITIRLDPNDVVDTHRFADGQEVARIDASFPSGTCTDETHQHMGEEPSRRYCRTCGANSLFYSTRYMTCARTHFRVKYVLFFILIRVTRLTYKLRHGREPAEEDIIDMDF